MIRKIVLAFVALFIVTWLALAHFAKSKVMSFISNFQTDNARISYSDASIAGFPFSWKVRFASPKFTIIDQDISREISCFIIVILGDANLTFQLKGKPAILASL